MRFDLPLMFRRAVYRASALLEQWLPSLSAHIVILCYHSIGEDWRFSVKKDDFIHQIKLLRASGYRFVPLSDVHPYINREKPLREKLAVLTFDDGYQDILSIRDFIKAERLKPTVFVLAEPASAAAGEVAPGKTFLSIEEILSLHRDGWEIGCHSTTHADFSMLQDEEVLAREIRGAKLKLEQELKTPIRYFAYPKGFHDARLREAVRHAGYALGLSMDDRIMPGIIDRYAVPRIGVDLTHSPKDTVGMVSAFAIRFRMLVKRLVPQHLINLMLGIR